MQAAGCTHTELARLEQKELATDHNELTACLLADWGIPQTLVESAYYHENPDSCSYPTGSRAYLLVRSLNLAVRLSEVLTAPGERRPWALAELFASGARLGLDAEAMIALADQLVREWQEWGRVLKVTTQNVASFADLSQIFRDLPAADPGDGLVEARGSGALRVMVVDGHWPALLQLQETLREAGHEVCIATDGEDALKVALERRPQVVIADWIMPNMDGVSLCRALRETKVGNSMYLVLLAEDEEESTLETAFEAGVDDCKVKPLNYRALVSRMRTFERVIKLREEIELDREEIRRFAGDLAIANKRLQESALVDALTQIPNRRYAVDRMHTEWVAAQRSGDPLSCMMIDIDCFKRINDNYGHACGDGILRAVAQVLKINARAGDVVARLGGEEFLVICPGTRLVEAGQSAERLRSAVQTSSLDDRVPDGEQITVSIGVAMIEDGMCGSEDVIELADQALYVAKHTGRNRACVAHSRNLIFPVRAVQPFVSEPGIAPNAANLAH